MSKKDKKRARQTQKEMQKKQGTYQPSKWSEFKKHFGGKSSIKAEKSKFKSSPDQSLTKKEKRKQKKAERKAARARKKAERKAARDRGFNNAIDKHRTGLASDIKYSRKEYDIAKKMRPDSFQRELSEQQRKKSKYAKKRAAAREQDYYLDKDTGKQPRWSTKRAKLERKKKRIQTDLDKTIDTTKRTKLQSQIQKTDDKIVLKMSPSERYKKLDADLAGVKKIRQQNIEKNIAKERDRLESKGLPQSEIDERTRRLKAEDMQALDRDIARNREEFGKSIPKETPKPGFFKRVFQRQENN